MRSHSVLSVLAVATAATAQTQPAPVITNNPVGAQYVATLPDKNSTTLRGVVQIQSSADGEGVDVSVAVSALPEGDHFMYHIHEKPVPADGNCTGTGAHLDPYKRGEVPTCDASKPETCQTGDLSGKHGNITTRDFSAKYLDPYLATISSDPSYFGHLSVVFHHSNKTRISCANFTLVSPGAGVTAPASSGFALPTGTGTGGSNTTVIATHTPTANGTGSPMAPTAAPVSPPSPPQNNAGQRLAAGAGALILAVAAFVL